MIRKPMLLLSLLVASLVPAQTLHAEVLAKINGKTISLEEFEKMYKDNLKFFQFKAPSQKAVLEDMIKRELGIQEAKRLGLDKDPAVISRMNAVLYQALLEKELSKDFSGIRVSDAEAKAYYAKHPEIRTSHIFVPVPPNATAEQDRKARAEIERIQHDYLEPGKMSFAAVAQKYSQGVAAPMGGDIDYQTPDKLDPAYYAAALRLRVGGVSGIVRSAFGYHIIKLTAIRPWSEADQVLAKRMVFEEKRAEIFARYMSKLRKQARVVEHPDLLKD